MKLEEIRKAMFTSKFTNGFVFSKCGEYVAVDGIPIKMNYFKIIVAALVCGATKDIKEIFNMIKEQACENFEIKDVSVDKIKADIYYFNTKCYQTGEDISLPDFINNIIDTSNRLIKKGG